MSQFRHKLVLVFVLLVVAIIASMVIIVNNNITHISREKIENDLKESQDILNTYFIEKNKSDSRAIQTMVLTQANIRAVLGTISGDEDDLFGDEDTVMNDSKLLESSELMASTVEYLPLFQKSEIFVIINSAGQVIFTKNGKKKYGQNLFSLPLVQAVLNGQEAHSFWSVKNQSEDIKSLFPTEENNIFQIFAKPVEFQGQVKGLVLVGFSLSKEVLGELTKVARAGLGFSLNDQIQIFSEHSESELDSVGEVKMIKEGSQRNVGDIFTLSSLEQFIVYPWPLKNSLGQRVGTTVMYRSMTQELVFFNSLKNLFLVSGLISGVFALILAVFFSGTVTRAISSLIQGVREVQEGNLDHEVEVQTKDEFKSLADAFNNMTQGLKEKEMIKSTFKRYVNPKIVDSLLAEGEKLNLGGERRDVVIFFSDIANFTKISEKLTPEDTVQFLNRYLGAMTEIIEEHEGIVDKYIGDAILAYWVLTKNNQSGYEKACQVALKQQEVVKQLRHEWKDSKELSQFSMRIGLHGGQALMGNIGSTTRMDYTVIGDDVNTAARLESVNKLYGTNIIISQSIQQEIGEKIEQRELDSVYVVGKSEPVSIYELNADKTLKESFEKALKVYKSGEFLKAKDLFLKHKDVFREDKAAQVFIERCESLISNPPKNWNGTYQLSSK